VVLKIGLKSEAHGCTRPNHALKCGGHWNADPISRKGRNQKFPDSLRATILVICAEYGTFVPLLASLFALTLTNS
jgi:hypothetical protein